MIHTVTIDLNIAKLVEDIPLEVEFTVDIDEPIGDDPGDMVIKERWQNLRSMRVDTIMLDILDRINKEIARLIDEGGELAELARGLDDDGGTRREISKERQV